MIEIIIGAWVISLILSAILGLINLQLNLKFLKSTKLKNLQANLKKIELLWLPSNGSLTHLDNSLQVEDYNKVIKQCWLLMILSLFSILGLLLMVLAFIGIHFFGKTRTEIAIFNSPLVANPELNPKETQKILEHLGALPIRL